MKWLFSKILALACAVFSLFALLIPLRLRRWFAYRVRAIIYWLTSRVKPVRLLYQRMTSDQNKALASAGPAPSGEDTQPSLPSGDRVAHCFSGGTDSTLAAVYLAEKFDKVYLLTFRTPTTHQEEEATARYEKLVEKFGPDRFEHIFMDNTKIIRDVYYSHFWRDVQKWGLFKANFCGACKTAATIAAARFCVENDIRYLASGANKEYGVSEFFIGQMPATIPIFDEFLAKYGITGLAPVYDVERSDKALYEMGFLEDWKGAKFGLLLDGMAACEALRKRGQIACDQDTLTTIYSLGYCIPMKGHEKFQELSVEYTKAMFDEFGPKWMPKPKTPADPVTSAT
jgi:hypothetical protein